jgi:starch phosphorylase
MDLMGRVLPRHLEIICEIDRRLLQSVAELWSGDGERLKRVSIVDYGPNAQVRMAHLAVVGSHAVNGVSELHSTLLKKTLLADFYQLGRNASATKPMASATGAGCSPQIRCWRI